MRKPLRQLGAATLAALLGATKVLERDMHNLKVVVSGAGAAGVACTNIMLASGIRDIIVLDSKGAQKIRVVVEQNMGAIQTKWLKINVQ